MMRLPVLFLVLSLPLAAHAQTEVDGVGPVTEGEVDAFVVADVDRDGMLSFPEFREFVRQMARTGQPTARLIRNFAAYRIAFRRVDQDEDGFASPAELRNADDDFRENG
jgi:Ca2+-binding EF-hand superfamily protein